MGVEEVDPGDKPSDEVPFDEKPVESTPSASDNPAVPCPTTTTFPATCPATSSPATTPPMAEGVGFSSMTYSTYGVTPAATVPPIATAVSEPVASSSSYTGVPESLPRRYVDEYHRPAAAVYMTGLPSYAAPEPGYSMPASGFTSLSGLRGPESCVKIVKQVPDAEIREALRGATADLVGDLTPEVGVMLEPLVPPQALPTTMGTSPHRLQANHLVAGLANTLGGLKS